MKYKKNQMKISEFKKQQLKLIKKQEQLTGWAQQKSGDDRGVNLKREGQK